MAVGIGTVAALLCLTTSAPLSVVEEYDLGSRHGARLEATVHISPAENGTRHVEIEFRAVRSDHSLRTASFDGGLAINDRNVRIEAHDFVGLGHKQLFVSVENAGVGSYVLDFNGVRLKRLYSNELDRIRVKMVHSSGGWRLVEYYSKWEWEGKHDLGEGRHYGVNLVSRTLRWRNGRFVPVRPGRSRIAG